MSEIDNKIAWAQKRLTLKGEELSKDQIEAIKFAFHDTIDVPDIRNKLSPITHLVSMFEAGHMNYVKEALPKVKKSINYLAQRKIYDTN